MVDWEERGEEETGYDTGGELAVCAWCGRVGMMAGGEEMAVFVCFVLALYALYATLKMASFVLRTNGSSGKKAIKVCPCLFQRVRTLFFTLTMHQDPATTKFHQSLPYSVLPVSSGLAALHFSRGFRHANELAGPNSCAKCGSFLRNGDGATRLIRLKSAPSLSASRIIQTTCLICGSVRTTSTSRGNADLFPRKRRRPARTIVSIDEVVVSHHHHHHQQPSTVELVESPISRPYSPDVPLPPGPSRPPTMDAPAQPKQRPKKKSGLQDMLDRNRKRGEKEKRVNQVEQTSGLVAFLNNL